MTQAYRVSSFVSLCVQLIQAARINIFDILGHRTTDRESSMHSTTLYFIRSGRKKMRDMAAYEEKKPNRVSNRLPFLKAEVDKACTKSYNFSSSVT